MTHAEQLQAKDRKIAQLRERCALLEQLLGEGIRHGYFDPAKCSASWLLEANAAVSILLGFRSANTITWCAREHLRSSTKSLSVFSKLLVLFSKQAVAQSLIQRKSHYSRELLHRFSSGDC